jgi:hypothetical protein
VSTVLEVLKASTMVPSRPPRLRIQCAHCARIYIANYWQKSVSKLRYCMACIPNRPFTNRELAREASRKGHEAYRRKLGHP